ncbi:MAG: hypothetical protein QG656_1899 [Candidatus Hydrogenedentes bacterium]|nr:hypothetical protein [Candidatus Hydrogenedentota bacterium]
MAKRVAYWVTVVMMAGIVSGGMGYSHAEAVPAAVAAEKDIVEKFPEEYVTHDMRAAQMARRTLRLVDGKIST